VIPIEGAIVRHGDMFSDVSGAVSIDTLAKDFTVALNDRSVQAILLAIDSPGGESNGVAELTDLIHAARGQKPIEAYISHLGCSAAYWLASACDRIACDSTAMVGSIGVVAAVPNPEKDTKRTVEFVSSQSPHKRPNISTEGGRAQIQSRIDALADVFVASVARNRKVSQKTVLEQYGAGGILVGQAAVKAGMVDAVSSFERVLAAVAARANADGETVAAQDGGGNIVAQDEQVPGRSKGFWAWVRGDGGSDLPTDGPPQSEFTAIRAEPAGRSTDDPRVSQLEARNQQLEERIFATEAASFVEGLVRGNQALPAEAAALRDLYVQAARDDAAAGESIRVVKLTSALSARPVHVLTGERLKGEFALLPNTITTKGLGDAKELDDIEADTRAWAKKRNERAAR
jgi:ClpP class serine protease